ncbi:MAG TPA: CoA activase, partial [Verrucomicrobiae bacterium]
GKPFAVIETDGHSGDAGTRTRVEAFLHCVAEDRRQPCAGAVQNDFGSMQFSGVRLADLRGQGSPETLLVPYIGPASEAVAAVFRGLGLPAESLPGPDAESLRLGRRYTSGKECLPMPLTLGSLLQRLQRAKTGERFAYLMPSTNGPCRFGVYNLLNNIILERLGWRDRVRIWSPKDSGYFDDLPGGTEMLIFIGIVANDLLYQAQLDVRPVECVAGAAEKIYERYRAKLHARLEAAARGNLALVPALWQIATGNLFGVSAMLQRAGAEFAAVRGREELPLVELAGEIYVRAVEFSNDFLIGKLEARGLRVRLAPKREWIDYCGYHQRHIHDRGQIGDDFSNLIRQRIEAFAFGSMSPYLRWTPPPRMEDVLAAASPYVSQDLCGEAVLTVGAPLHEWRHGQKIDALINVGPLECMPSKIAEAQLQPIAEREGLLSLTLPLNGDPVNETALDNFAYEVRARFLRSKNGGHRDGGMKTARLQKA